MHAAKRSTSVSSVMSQDARSHAAPLVERTIGERARAAIAAGRVVKCSVRPFVQSCPRFAGCSGSPRTPAIDAPSCSTMTPQPTPQYGQVVRVSTALAPSVRFAERDVDDALVIGANRKCARAAMIGGDGAARFELDRPVVQRTRD